ncbi:MAG TPA: SBBP repeat-containing protein [Polyangiaceae bacterium]
MTRPTRFVLLASIAVSPLLVACGSGSDGGPAVPTSPAATATPGTGGGSSGGNGATSSSGGSSGGGSSSSGGSTTPTSNGGKPMWTAHLGGPQADVGYALAADKEGNVVLVGFYQGTANLGGVPMTSAGQVDFFVAKYDAAGNAMWVRPFGGPGNDMATGVAIDLSGNVYVAGASDGALTIGGSSFGANGATGTFLFSLDPLGNVLSAKAYGGDSFGTLAKVAVSANGTIGLAGSYKGTIDFGGGPLTAAMGSYAGFVAEFDGGGNLSFANSLGTDSTTMAQGLSFKSDESIAVVGSFSGTGQFGTTTLTSVGQNDVFVAAFDSAGNPLWSKSWGGITNDDGRGIAYDANGNLVVTGGFSSSVDFGGGAVTSKGGTDAFVMKLNASHTLAWVQTFGGTLTDEAVSVAIDTTGDPLVGGLFESTMSLGGKTLTSSGDKDIFAIKMDSTGGATWAKQFGSVEADEGVSVAFDAKGNSFVTGYFRTNVDFGTGMQSSAGDDDIFIGAYAP